MCIILLPFPLAKLSALYIVCTLTDECHVNNIIICTVEVTYWQNINLFVLLQIKNCMVLYGKQRTCTGIIKLRGWMACGLSKFALLLCSPKFIVLVV